MNEFVHWEKKASGWVFLSHSSKDYEDVKIVRNYLEENGFSALMFYLKCLENDDKKHFMENLIKCEIQSRNIFVLCKSANSDDSKWVQMELSEVSKVSGKIIKEISMDTLKYKRATALSELDDLINYATLYFISNYKDKDIVEQIYAVLNSRGFKIFRNNPNTTSRKKEKNISFSSAIQEVSEQGTILIFLSKHVLDSQRFWNEKDLILDTKNKDYIVPILLDDVDINNFPAFENSDYLIKLQNSTFDEQIEKISNMINMVRNNKKDNDLPNNLNS